MSQKKVARSLGIADTSTLSRWEKGVVLPNLMHLFRLARLYHTFPHQLYDDLWQSSLSDDDLLAHYESHYKNQIF